MTRIWLASATLALALWVVPAYAQRPPQSLSYFESIERPDLTTEGFELSIFGRRFDVSLERNDALLSRLPLSQRQAASGIELWKGKLKGLPDSWVRITRRGNLFSGVVWDGAGLYVIEASSRTSSRLAYPNAVSTSDLIVYQLDGSTSFQQDLVLRSKTASVSSSKIGFETVNLSSSPLPNSPVLEIDIGLIADADYSRFAEQTLGSDATTELLTVANILDGIFLLQVGLRIRVVELIAFSSEPDGFSLADPPGLLSEVAQFKGDNAALAPLGVAHLVTGRELEEPGSNEIIGIANFASVCDADSSVSLTQGTFSSTRTALIAAHEIAHNLGAPHDAESGSICAAEPLGFLMDPNISGNDEFSQCSIDQMQTRIAAAVCVRPVPETDVSITSMDTRVDAPAGWSHSASFLLENNGLSDALGIEVVLETSPELAIDDPSFPDADGWRCEQELRIKTCRLDILPAGESIYIGHRQTAVALGTATTTATVVTANDADSTNNVATYVLEILPAVKLRVVDFAKSTDVARPGLIVDVTVEMLNEGVVDATNVGISIWLPHFFELESVALPSGGSCSPTLLGTHCQMPMLPIGDPRFAELRLRTLDLDIGTDQVIGDNLRVMLGAAEPDANENEWWVTNFSATPVWADVELSVDAPSRGDFGETAEFTFDFTNHGPDTVAETSFAFSNTGMVIDSWEGSGTACVLSSDATSVECDPGAFSAHETRTLTIRGVTPRIGAYTVSYSLSAEAFSFDPVDNSDSHSWAVLSSPASPPPPDPQAAPPPSDQGGSSGGGGGFGALALLFLFLQWFADRQRLSKARRPPR